MLGPHRSSLALMVLRSIDTLNYRCQSDSFKNTYKYKYYYHYIHTLNGKPKNSDLRKQKNKVNHFLLPKYSEIKTKQITISKLW